MRFQRQGVKTKSALRGGLLAAAGLSYLVASVGIPVPMPHISKDRSVAFPCMDRACGCHNAAACKEHCCCFSSEEKLDWAAVHHVDAAPFVNNCQEESARPDWPAGSSPCCTTSVPRHASRGGATEQDDASGGYLSIAAYRQCAGMQPLWTVLGAALAPPERVRHEFDWSLTGQADVPNSCRPVSLAFAPPTPPPRS